MLIHFIHDASNMFVTQDKTSRTFHFSWDFVALVAKVCGPKTEEDSHGATIATFVFHKFFAVLGAFGIGRVWLYMMEDTSAC